MDVVIEVLQNGGRCISSLPFETCDSVEVAPPVDSPFLLAATLQVHLQEETGFIVQGVAEKTGLFASEVTVCFVKRNWHTKHSDR
jgi:hypothetical protein